MLTINSITFTTEDKYYLKPTVGDGIDINNLVDKLKEYIKIDAMIIEIRRIIAEYTYTDPRNFYFSFESKYSKRKHSLRFNFQDIDILKIISSPPILSQNNIVIRGTKKYARFIYIIHDYNQDYSKAMERYDIVKNDWKQLSNLTINEEDYATAFCGNLIYVTGGVDQAYMCLSCECTVYDVDKNQWTMVNYMKRRRKRHRMMSLGEKVYAIGGEDQEDHSTKSSCEFYNREKK